MSAALAASSMSRTYARGVDARASPSPQAQPPAHSPSLKYVLLPPQWRRPSAAPSRASLKAHCLSSQPLLPVRDSAVAFAPATVANLGPGFDWMGCAVQGQGDTVEARVLPGEPAIETLAMMPGGLPACGVALRLHKGLPLGSGAGSSAASAAAACWAVNNLFGNVLSKEELVYAGLKSEAMCSGNHADNIAPALMGGFVLIRSVEPLDLVKLPFQGKCKFVLVTPEFETPTREMRAALPSEVPFKSMISNNVAGGSLVAGILQGDVPLMGKALGSEIVVEAARGKLIPGFEAVKAAATAAGAYGCTISGAGPTVVAIVDDADVGKKVAAEISEAFWEHGQLETNTTQIVDLCTEGAATVDAMPSESRPATWPAVATAA